MSTEPASRTGAAPSSRWDQWDRENAQRALAVLVVVAMAVLAWFWVPEMWGLREPCAGEGPGCAAPPAWVSWAGFFAGVVAIPTGVATAAVLLWYATRVEWSRFAWPVIANFTMAMVAWAALFALGRALD